MSSNNSISKVGTLLLATCWIALLVAYIPVGLVLAENRGLLAHDKIAIYEMLYTQDPERKRTLIDESNARLDIVEANFERIPQIYLMAGLSTLAIALTGLGFVLISRRSNTSEAIRI